MGISRAYVDARVMGRHLRIAEPELEHIEELAQTMRQADKDEIRRYSGNPPREDLNRAVDISSYARTALVDGRVIAMFGLVEWPAAPGSGSPWCFASDIADSYRRAFAMFSRFYLDEIRERCPNLFVEVDALHDKAVRWLRWLGFTLEPVTCNGHDFYLASIKET